MRNQTARLSEGVGMTLRSFCRLARQMAFACVFATATACSSQLSRGERAYDAGAHPKAMRLLLDAEQDYALARGRTRAKYALYRGLTHLSLGDKFSAERWLAESKAWVDRDRDVLDASDRGKLTTAWISIGHEPGTWGREVLAGQ